MPAYDDENFTPPAPVAHVALRHLETKATASDIPMLIDSGADITLIPKSSAAHIGADINSSKGYELIGFDGTRSIAPSVQLDLLFLKRAFSGRFLVIDHPSGVLGRDILNHIAIHLNGPQLQWGELASPNAP